MMVFPKVLIVYKKIHVKEPYTAYLQNKRFDSEHVKNENLKIGFRPEELQSFLKSLWVYGHMFPLFRTGSQSVVCFYILPYDNKVSTTQQKWSFTPFATLQQQLRHDSF